MSGRRLESDVVVVGPASPVCPRRGRSRSSGSDGGRARSARPGRRPRAQPRPRRGDVVEIGGEWIGPAQLRVNKLVAELGLETFPTYDEGEHLLDLKRPGEALHGRDPAACPKAALVDLGQSQFRFDRLAKRVPLEAPWAADQAERWDEETFATWVRRNTRTASARFFWEVFSEAVFAAEPQDMSLLHALAYTHSGGGVNSLIGVRNAAQQDRIVGGSQLIAQRLAEPLGDELQLGAPVRHIAQRADGVTVEADGVTVRARRVIVSIPPVLAGRITYEPALPPQRDLLTQKMPAGSVIKVNVVYDEPFWRADGLSGQAAGDRAPIKFTFDNSPPSGTPGRARVLPRRRAGAAVRPDRRRRAPPRGARVARRLLRPARGQADRLRRAGLVGRGVDARLLRRAPRARRVTQFGPALREPVGRIHWAGTETAGVWSGYMDGALTSGERAAAEVLAAGSA